MGVFDVCHHLSNKSPFWRNSYSAVGLGLKFLEKEISCMLFVTTSVLGLVYMLHY